jgi:amino acid transporter
MRPRSSSEYLPAFSAHPRRTAKDCKLQFFSIFLVSPTYQNHAYNSFLSPTYAKSGGWPSYPAKFLKSYLQCRNFDILAFSPAFLHFFAPGLPNAAQNYSRIVSVPPWLSGSSTRVDNLRRFEANDGSTFGKSATAVQAVSVGFNSGLANGPTMDLMKLVVGRPLRTSEERGEQIGPMAGIPIFGLDALSSAAYGPEAALSLMIPLGLAGVRYIVPISAAIITLLVIVYFSYRQTIEAYPMGGGSYTVARFNLGTFWGLLAAAALMGDYILTAAVGISAGVGALVSAVPSLLPHIVSLCLGILLVITIINLRGVKDAGVVFMIPTYLFVGCIGVVIIGGIIKVMASGGHPAAVTPLPAPPAAVQAVTWWLLLRVFSSGCTALTGVEAVSNGVRAFKDSAVKNAQTTLTVIIAMLAVLLAGISYLVKAYGIVATTPGAPGYQSLLSMLISAVFGKGIFYYVSIASILLVLSLSANTAFADFPRLCRAISQNNYLPHGFAQRGRRLVYTEGILVLAILTALLLLLFQGVTDRLIPLYAVGAFLAFTLSQSGMVRHWWRQRSAHWEKFAMVNGLGALVTGITVIVVLVAKFLDGAWITILFMPLMLLAFRAVRQHYHKVAVASRTTEAVIPRSKEAEPIVIVPIDRWSAITKQGLEFASRLSAEMIAVHVEPGEHATLLQEDWDRYVVAPYEQSGSAPPELKILPSPYRFVVLPVVQYVLDLSEKYPTRQIVVVIPEFVEDRWYEYLLHNQRARLLSWMLLARGNKRISTLASAYYLPSHMKDIK